MNAFFMCPKSAEAQQVRSVVASLSADEISQPFSDPQMGEELLDMSAPAIQSPESTFDFHDREHNLVVVVVTVSEGVVDFFLNWWAFDRRLTDSR